MCVRSIVALLLFCVLMLMGMLSGGQLHAFIDTPSFLITVAGGLLLAMISYSIGTIWGSIGKGFGGHNLDSATADEAARALRGLGSSFVSAGVIGTIIGLINIGNNLDDYDSLLPGLATAAITLYYGLFIKYAITEPLRRSVENRVA